MKLSKTNFITYLDCRKNAWLKIHRPDIYYEYPLSSFEQNIIETGNEIDVLARDLFPGGVLIEDPEDNELTQQLIDQQTKVIYQPVFTTDKFLTACDILVWNDDNSLYDLYEVKSSTASATTEGSSRATKEYLTDIAFQKTVLTDSDVTVGQTYLIRLNKAFVRTGNINLQELFLIEDVSEWFNLNSDSPYMLLVADVVNKRRREISHTEQSLFGIDKLNVPRSEIPAVTHVDYSARIQTVHRDTNPKYYRLLRQFKAETGCPVLVNTSFNVRGEPIVCSPTDAFKCFMGTDLDLLVIENFMLRKFDKDQSDDADDDAICGDVDLCAYDAENDRDGDGRARPEDVEPQLATAAAPDWGGGDESRGDAPRAAARRRAC